MVAVTPGKSASCPALFITAPASGQGKTTVTAALARLFKNQGRVVRVFKSGPDYLDPQILEQASGHAVEQLDLWMAGEAYCRQRLFEAAQTADLILIEGVMGMFDGDPSSADLAARFGIPMAVVMDVKGMAQTAAAVLTGLAGFRDDVTVLGLIANACGSQRHSELIRDALPEHLPLLAALKRDPSIALPERHLGLVQASEVRDDLEARFNAGADALQVAGMAEHLANLPATVFHPADEAALAGLRVNRQPLAGKRVAIARDAAFSFIYQANIDTLIALGADVCFFSPLHDTTLPTCDAIWLPGGYPELHGGQLAANKAIRAGIHACFQADMPILAECGGLLYSLESLTDLDDRTYPMLGILPGEGAMRGKRGCQGMQTAVFPEGEVRAHAHHRSRSGGTPEPITHGRRQRHPAPGEPIYRQRGLTATYLHLFFPNNPLAIGRLFSVPEQAGQGLDTNVVATADQTTKEVSHAR